MEDFRKVLESVKFVNETWVFMIPGILMAIDILTGSLNAWAKQDFKSYKMRQGLVKKCGEVTILGDTETKMYMKFHEYNSMAYLGQFEDDSAFSRIDVRQTKEQWHCEYYEDYFIATVVCSERYSPGQIFRFNKK